jgi:hypothetical protein
MDHTTGKIEMHTELQSENLKARYHSVDLGVKVKAKLSLYLMD